MMRRIAAMTALTAIVSMPLAAHTADKKPSASTWFVRVGQDGRGASWAAVWQ